MNGFIGFLEKNLVPIAAKIGAQRHLVAIRDGFIALIPITMIGAFATLINNLPFEAYQNFMLNTFGENWKTWTGDIWWGTLAVLAVLLAASIAYYLGKSYGDEGIQPALISTAIFFALCPQSASITPEGAAEAVVGWGFLNWGYLNSNALFTAIIVALVSTEIYLRIGRIKKLTINLPESVPPAVSRSFAKLLPGMMTIGIMVALSVIIRKVTDMYLTDLINIYIAKPLTGVADSLPSAIIIALAIHVLWFFGLHGSNILLPITKPLTTNLGAQNAQFAEVGLKAGEQFNVLAGPFFDAFVFMGGAGVCVGLMIAILIAGKRRRYIVALGGAPSVFNINEPVIFGLPLVLNPMFVIPFLLAPIILTITSYLAIQAGLVSPVIVPEMPWVTPPIAGGLLATGHWSGAVLAGVNLVLSVLIYLPFVIAAEKMDAKKEAEVAQIGAK